MNSLREVEAIIVLFTRPFLVAVPCHSFGQNLGSLNINTLVRADQIIATTRNPERLADLAAQGVVVRRADFTDPATLPTAFAGASRLLIISTDTIGQRVEQHKAAIEAAAIAG